MVNHSTNVNKKQESLISWYLDLQLTVESVLITSNVMRSNPIHDEMYSIQHYVIKFVSDSRQVSSFLGFSDFLHQ